MRVIISGGGTGGHIYPAIAIANKIKKENSQAKILFVGTEKGMESDIIPKEGYEIKPIKVSYLKRKISVHNIKSAAMLLQGLWQATRIIRDFKPDIVIGTGGFVSGPVVYAASKLGINTMIHEQNVFPGIANKILGRYAEKIAISFEEAEKYFKQKEKLIVTGNPIRETFFNISEEEAEKRYHAKTNKPVVLIVGGSGGSVSINKAVCNMLIKHPQNNFEVLLVTGKKHYDQVIQTISKHREVLQHNTIKEYINDMPYALKACDLIVCSAGAITITEINAVGKPSILIPKAYTAENHQEYNAKALETRGAAVVIREQYLNSDSLRNSIQEIFQTREKYESMKKASFDASKKHATAIIYDEIIKLVKRK